MAVDFTRVRPNESRRPEFIELPDGRKRLTRWFALASGEKITDALVENYGTLDLGDTTGPTAGFAGLRLINQYLEKSQTRQGNESDYVKVYEELHPTAEMQIGGLTEIELEDGRKAWEGEFWQFASNPYVPGIVGTATAPGDVTAFLRSATATNDGTLRKIKRQYVRAGILATDDESLNGGKLLKKTITSAVTAPETPEGFTLVGSPVQNPDGLPVYTYTFYKGDGEISRRESSDNDGKLLRVAITHLTALSVNVQPTADPLAGGVRVITDKSDEAGHRVWAVTWAKGSGEIARSSSDDNGGKLQRVSITHLTASSVTDQPTTDPLSGGVAVTVEKRDEAAHRVWSVTWAKGSGEIARNDSSDSGGALQRVAITHLTALDVAVQPTADPLSGGVAIVTGKRDEAGHRVWSVTWAKGSGEVTRRETESNCGALQRVTITHLTALDVAVQPTSDPLSGGVLVDSGRSDEAGHRVWSVTWVKGVGIIGERTQPRDGGLLLLNRDILVAPGVTDISAYAPAAGILMMKDYSDLDGHRRWSVTWMQTTAGGSPTTGTALSYEDYVEFTYPGRAKYYVVPYTTGGYTSHRAHDIFLAPAANAKVLADVDVSYQTSAAIGALTHPLWNPVAYASLRARWIGWSNSPRSKNEGLRGYTVWGLDVTGTASTDVVTCAGHGLAAGWRVYFTSLTGGAGLAVEAVYYVRDVTSTTFKLAATLGGSAIDITSDITAAHLKLSGFGGTSGATGTDTSVLGDRVYGSTDWEIGLSGGPDEPDGKDWTLDARVDPAFTGADGTQYYRRTVISASIPARVALPV